MTENLNKPRQFCGLSLTDFCWQMQKMKKDMATEQDKNITQMGNTIAKTIAEGFLPRVTTSNDDLKNVQNKCTSKQKLDDVDGHSSKCVS